MPVAPPIRAMLDAAARADAPPLESLTIEQARIGAEAFAAFGAGEKQEVARIDDRFLPGLVGDIPVRVYVPEGPLPKPTVAFFHGGGWVIMGIETHDWTCRRLANASGAIVVSVDYRLAPEHRYPAALDDCMAVTTWLAEHAGVIGGDPDRLAVAGDSAGGNLAAAVALASRTEGGPRLSAQALVYPVTDAACATPSFVQNADGYLLAASTMRWFWEQYLGPDGDPDDGYASVLRAPDLSGLPPTLIITAEFDPLRDEGEAYGEHLREAGVDATVHRYDGMIHGFLSLPEVTEDATVAMNEIGDFLRRALA